VRRTGLSLTVLAGLAIAAVPAAAQAPAAPVTGRVIMDGTWDLKPQVRRGGLPAQWLGLQVKPGRRICFALSCSRYALRLVKTPTRDGSRAARFEVRNGDNPFGDSERAEVQGRITGRAGNLRWYTWSTFLPRNFRFQGANDNRFLVLTQWAVERGSAPIGIYVDRGHVTLAVIRQRNPRTVIDVHRPWGTPIQPLLGRWVDFALFVRWSQGAGQVQLWVDGVQQTMNWPFGGEGSDPAVFGGVGATAFTGRTMVPGGGPTFVRQGILRAKALSGTTVVTHDALKVYAATGFPPLPAPAPAPLPPPTP
jgi:Polysaccharide lyase